MPEYLILGENVASDPLSVSVFSVPQCHSHIAAEQLYEYIATISLSMIVFKDITFKLNMNAGNSTLLRASCRMSVCGLRRLSTMRACSTSTARTFSHLESKRENVVRESIAGIRSSGLYPRPQTARGFRTSTVTAALKNGIVGLPNVGKVCSKYMHVIHTIVC